MDWRRICEAYMFPDRIGGASQNSDFQNFFLTATPNHHYPPRVPPLKGAYRDRHGTWGGMRWTHSAGRNSLARRAAFVRTAKSCGSGAPTLALSERNDPRMTGAKKP